MSTRTDLWIIAASIAAWIAIIALVVIFADKAESARWLRSYRSPRSGSARQARICFVFRALGRIPSNCNGLHKTIRQRLNRWTVSRRVST
jgi:hypothetical protein